MKEVVEPIRVLLADDHAVVRAGIRQFLEHAPDITEVAEANDGAAARVLTGEHLPDVVVLDIQMPEASGTEVTRWARAGSAAAGRAGVHEQSCGRAAGD